MNNSEETKDVIRKLFRDEQLKGSTVDAMAIIYQECTGTLPSPRLLASRIMIQFKSGSGLIPHHVVLPETASIEMREATID